MPCIQRIISDNDGCDLWTCVDPGRAEWAEGQKYAGPSREQFLASRFQATAEGGVTTVFYTTHTQFGVVNYDSGLEWATYLGDMVNMPRYPAVQYGLDFCHEHGMEFFACLRMNDTHDGHTSAGSRAAFTGNRFKMAHPELLLGSYENPPPFGRYSAVNYARAEVRAAFMQMFEEQLERFDVDGMALDFFRHACFFQSTAAGLPATGEETACMTQLIRDAAAACRRAAGRRGHPVSLAVRVPDDLDCARYLGLDVEEWLRAGCIDLLCVSSYLHLNYWDYSVELGHRYGVPVYPSLDEPRLPCRPGFEGEPRLRRRCFDATRGRVLNALGAGADGYILYNYRNEERHGCIFRAVTDSKRLHGGPKRYFSSFRSVEYGPGSADPKALRDFYRIPVLSPACTEKVGSGYDGEIYLGVTPREDEDALLNLWFGDGVEKPDSLDIWYNSSITPVNMLRIFLNGVPLTDFLTGELLPSSLPRATVKAFIPPGLLHRGPNSFRVENLLLEEITLTDAAIIVIPAM